MNSGQGFRLQFGPKRGGGGRGMCGPIGVGFLRHVGLESGMVFEGSTTGVYERIYRFNSK